MPKTSSFPCLETMFFRKTILSCRANPFLGGYIQAMSFAGMVTGHGKSFWDCKAAQAPLFNPFDFME